jgi:hypothetical protein
LFYKYKQDGLKKINRLLSFLIKHVQYGKIFGGEHKEQDEDEVEVEVEVNLRPTVSQPVCLGVRRPSRTRDQFYFLLEISFRQMRVCYL